MAAWLSSALLLAAIGGLGITGQIVLLRELVTAFSGNELSIAFMLAVWIACEAAGAFAFGVLFRRCNPVRWLGLLALLSVAVSAAAVPAAVLGRPLVGLLPGETLSIPALCLIAFAVVSLPAFTHGALFVTGAGLLGSAPGRTTIPGRAYLWEGIGTAIAALAISFGLAAGVSSLALVTLAAVPLAVALLLPGLGRSRLEKTCIVIALLCLPILLLFAGRMEQLAWQRHWPGQTVQSVANSAYGKVVRIARAGQQQVFFAGAAALTSPTIDFARTEQVVGLPLLLHPRPERVLILGQALGGPVAVALRHGAKQVVTTEPDAVLARELAATDDTVVNAELANPRHRRLALDPRRLLAADSGRFDVITILPSAPFSLSANRLFSLEAFLLCRRQLNPGGILCLNSPGSADRTRLAPDLERMAGLRLATLERAFAHVLPLAADIPLFIAAGFPLNPPPETLARRLATRAAAGQVLDSVYLVALLDGFRQQEFTRRLTRAVSSGGPNTDLHPREVALSIVRENRTVSGVVARLYDAAINLRLRHLLVGLGLLLCLSLAAARTLGRRFAVGTAIVTSGFCGAGISVILLFAYQTRFGTLYTHIALLLGAFMLGSVLGSAAAVQLTTRLRSTSLLLLEIALLLLCVLAALASPVAPARLFVIMQLAAGTCLGAQFAVAGAEAAASPAARTGLLAGLDLVGGALGMLVCGLVLVPGLGLVVAALALTGVKSASALGLALSRPDPAWRWTAASGPNCPG